MAILFAGNDLSQIGGTTLDITAGTFDSNYVSESNIIADNTSYALDFGTSSTDEVWLHVDVKLNPASIGADADGYMFTATDTNGNILVRIHGEDGLWRMSLRSTTSFPSANGPLVAIGTTLRTWDIRVFNDGTTVTGELYLDGAIVSSASEAAGGRGPARQFDVGGLDNGGYNISQIIVSDTSQVGRKLGIIRPAGAGADTAWTGDFNQLGDNDITSVAFTDTIGTRVSSIPAAWTGVTTGTIENVVPIGIGLSTGTGPQSIAHYLKIGGTNYDGTAQPQNSVADFFVEEYPLNPATGLAWQFADLSAIEVGLLSGT